LPKSSSPKRTSLLIAAISGRALAAAAERAGFTPLVADFFADADTVALAHGCRKLEGDLAQGMTWRALQASLSALAEAAPSPIAGLVYGSGFEDHTDLLARLAEHWPLLGNDARTVERVKAPEGFFAALDRLGVPHPRTVTEPPPMKHGWLAKRRGGAGGSHIRPSVSRQADASVYFQERIAGRSISALFVANGTQARVLGFSAQWTAPLRGRPFRYGGVVRSPELNPRLAQTMTAAVEQVAAAFALKGLGSADFIVRQDDEALLLEINPRPGATLDIFDSGAQPLLRLHREAVEGRLPSAGLGLVGAAASAIVFAPKRLIVGGLDWPDWTADRPKCGDRIDKNRPICTVLARAQTPIEAKGLVEERISIILAACGGKIAGGEGELEQKNGRERNAPRGDAERQRQGRAAGRRPHS
jgi:predicted ATP-grasp superfamily ATP-dependent carboligase